MKYKHLFLTVLFVLLIACGRNENSTESCDEFEFKNLGTYANDWASELTYQKIDSGYYERKLKMVQDFPYYELSSFYFVCSISRKNIQGDVIVKANGPELEMYFIAENKKPFLLACMVTSPDDFHRTKSKLTDDQLEMSTIYMTSEGNGNYQDSIFTRFELIEHNIFKRVGYDSVRVSLDVNAENATHP